MDNGPRPPSYNFFISPEQVEIMYNAIISYEADMLDLKPTPAYKVAMAALRQKIVNLRDAIKRRAKKEIRP